MADHLTGLGPFYGQRGDALADAARGRAGRAGELRPAGRRDVPLGPPRRQPPSGSRAAAGAVDAGVAFVPGEAFYVDGSGGDRIRLSFATLTPDELGEAARRPGPPLDLGRLSSAADAR